MKPKIKRLILVFAGALFVQGIGAFELQPVDVCPLSLQTDGFITTVTDADELIQAIECANLNGEANGGDTINLGNDISLTQRYNNDFGGNGTPYISGSILLDGKGFGISRSNTATEAFRILYVNETGNLELRNITLSNGLVTGFDGGGAIENTGTISRIQNSTFSGNQAEYGGAIENYNPSRTADVGIIQNSTFSGNSALSFGGGIYSNSTITNIQNSTISGNSADKGGGIFIYKATINSIQNTTFSGNSAINGGGVFVDQYSTITTIQNSTFSGNSADVDGKVIFLNAAEILNFNNILFHNNISQTNANACGFIGGGIINNSANNISDDPNNNCPNTNSTLDTLSVADLADNGGPTMTHALLFGSQALNAAVNGTSTDQRGFAVSDGLRDIGAYEAFVPVVIAPADLISEATGPLSSPSLGTATVTDVDETGLTATANQTVDFILGSTSVTWTATDSQGFTGSDIQIVTIVDTTPPVLSLIGADPITLLVGDTYVDAGATATDLVDDDNTLTDNIVVSNLPNTSIAGTYVINYDVSDNAGNVATTLTRTVNVEVGVLSLSSNSLDYGAVFSGDQVNQVITVSNTGSSAVYISDITNPAEPFVITGGSCTALPLTLADGNSCDIEVLFNPNGEGNFSDIFQIISNAASSPDEVILSGSSSLRMVSTLSQWALMLLVLLVTVIMVTNRHKL